MATPEAPAAPPGGVTSGTILAILLGIMLVIGLGIGYPLFILRAGVGDPPSRADLEPPANRFFAAMALGDLAAAQAECTDVAAKVLPDVAAKRPEVWGGAARIDGIETQQVMATWLGAAKATVTGKDGKERRVQLGLVKGAKGWIVAGATVEGEPLPLFPPQKPK